MSEIGRLLSLKKLAIRLIIIFLFENCPFYWTLPSCCIGHPPGRGRRFGQGSARSRRRQLHLLSNDGTEKRVEHGSHSGPVAGRRFVVVEAVDVGPQPGLDLVYHLAAAVLVVANSDV